MTVPIRLLIIDDSKSDADLILRQLKIGGYSPTFCRVENSDDLKQALKNESWDLVVCDVVMPLFSAPEALKIVREFGLDIPFIVVSGSIGEDIAVSMLKSGVNDYLLKDNMARFLPAIQRELREADSRRELRKAEERIYEQARLLNLAQDAILVLSLDGVIQFWNLGAEKMLGWKSDEAVGRVSTDLYCAGTNRFDDARTESQKHGVWSGELALQTKSGDQILVTSRWNLVRDGHSQPKSFLVINTDITEKKRLENQLLRAQRLDGIGILAAGIAHDLNNILAPILIASELLQTQALTPDCERFVNTIVASAQRGESIIKQILTFCREGKPGEPRILSLKLLLREIGGFLQSTFPKAIQFAFHLPDNIWPVKVDPVQIEQVVMNLCINSRDAMPGGGGITISLKNVDVPSSEISGILEGNQMEELPGSSFDEVPRSPKQTCRFVVLQVADTGSGISKEIKDKIFHPFFTTKELGKGTGLGLSTVLGIVKHHAGFIQVSSDPGQGTTFRVYIPASHAEEEKHPEKFKMTVAPGNGELVMVVDDEPLVRETLQKALEANGFTVIAAPNGAAALGVFSAFQQKIKLVITDLAMPTGDGFRLIEAILKIAPDARIIVLSAIPDFAKERERLRVLGVSRFLQKPSSLDELLHLIQETLQFSGGERGQ